MTKKESAIKKAIKKYNKIYESITDDKKELINELISNVAFMEVTLKELQDDININGITEEYKNGANQYGTKQSVAANYYNTLIKNYNQSIKVLNDQLPKNETKKETDDFAEFLKARADYLE